MYSPLNPPPGVSANSAVEQVEILDNGKHLGYADLIEGRWQYIAAGLDVAGHAITAVYKGITSSPWQFDVVRSETHTETFVTAPFGRFLTLIRAYYAATSVSPERPGTGEEQFYPSSLLDYGGARYLYLTAYYSNDSYEGRYNCDLTMEFTQTYSEIFIDCFSLLSNIAVPPPVDILVHALDSRGETDPVAEYKIPRVVAQHYIYLKAEPQSGRRIKFLRFTVTAMSTTPKYWGSLRVKLIQMKT